MIATFRLHELDGSGTSCWIFDTDRPQTARMNTKRQEFAALGIPLFFFELGLYCSPHSFPFHLFINESKGSWSQRVTQPHVFEFSGDSYFHDNSNRY